MHLNISPGKTRFAEGKIIITNKQTKLTLPFHTNKTRLENIYITKKGDWKLAGFGFAVGQTPPDPNNTVEIPNFQKPDALRLPLLYPSLDYSDPYFVAGNKPTFASDIFSFVRERERDSREREIQGRDQKSSRPDPTHFFELTHNNNKNKGRVDLQALWR